MHSMVVCASQLGRHIQTRRLVPCPAKRLAPQPATGRRVQSARSLAARLAPRPAQLPGPAICCQVVLLHRAAPTAITTTTATVTRTAKPRGVWASLVCGHDGNGLRACPVIFAVPQALAGLHAAISR